MNTHNYLTRIKDEYWTDIQREISINGNTMMFVEFSLVPDKGFI